MIILYIFIREVCWSGIELISLLCTFKISTKFIKVSVDLDSFFRIAKRYVYEILHFRLRLSKEYLIISNFV